MKCKAFEKRLGLRRRSGFFRGQPMSREHEAKQWEFTATTDRTYVENLAELAKAEMDGQSSMTPPGSWVEVPQERKPWWKLW